MTPVVIDLSRSNAELRPVPRTALHSTVSPMLLVEGHGLAASVADAVTLADAAHAAAPAAEEDSYVYVCGDAESREGLSRAGGGAAAR